MSGNFREFRAKAGAKSRPVSIAYGYSTRKAGYPKFYSVLEKRGPVAVPDQTHSDHVVRVAAVCTACTGRRPAKPNGTTSGKGQRDGVRSDISDCDALVTTESGRILTIRTADCLPIFFWDKKGKAIALAHAGWKGSHQRIAAKTVARLKHLGVDPKNLQIIFGPSIRPCCYEVGPEFVGRFETRTLRKNKAGRFQLDLILANRLQLEAAGVPKSAIKDLRLCTACDPATFFSFRRDPSNPGRMIHWIYKS